MRGNGPARGVKRAIARSTSRSRPPSPATICWALIPSACTRCESDNTATFCAVDLDIDKMALQRAHGDAAYAQSLRDSLRAEGPRLLGELRQLGSRAAVRELRLQGPPLLGLPGGAGNSRHAAPAGAAVSGLAVAATPAGLHLEFFPKQARLKGKGLGNLIKLPLGIHRRTGYRSRILDDQGQPVTDGLRELQAVRRAPRDVLYAAIERLKGFCPAAAARK